MGLMLAQAFAKVSAGR